MRPLRVLFLGVRNSTRSQMGEAILRSLAGNRVEVASAGVAPAPVPDLTRMVLAESGLSAEGQVAKSAAEFLGKATFHVVIIPCPPGEPRSPTMFFGALRRLVWDIADPMSSPAQERLDAFRHARDDVHGRVRAFLEQAPELALPPMENAPPPEPASRPAFMPAGRH